jgi:DNA mismatch repair protein MutL
VKETLGKFNIVPSIDFDTEGAPDIPIKHESSNIRPPQTSFNPNYNPFSQSNTYKRPKLDWEKLYEGFDNSPREEEQTKIWNENLVETNKFDSKLSAAIEPKESATETHQTQNFQLKNKYVLTGVKSGLLVIDQQRAHFRILFDMYMKQLEQKQGVSQQLLFPETLEFNESEKLVFEQIKPDLKSVGFHISEEENNIYSINGIPSQIEIGTIINLLHKVLSDAQAAVFDPTRQIHESIAASLAEASSLKTGQNLTNEEMNELIDQLFASTNHNYTPSGKKILSILSYEELEGRFK